MTPGSRFAIAISIALALQAAPAQAGLWDALKSAFCEKSLKVVPIDPSITGVGALRAVVESNLERKTEFGFEEMPEMAGRLPGEKINLRGVGGAWIATMTYFFEHDGIRIGSIDVAPLFQRQGVSEYLFALMLERYPKTGRIDTSLLETNLVILNRALEDGMECEDAIRETPAYKLRRRFGFNHIEVAYCDGMAGFVVTRTPQN